MDYQDDAFQALVHDLRNPLSLILGGLQLLRSTLSPDAGESLQYVDMIENGAKSMQQMLNGLLELARIESLPAPTREKVSVHDCLVNSARDYQIPAQRKNLTLRVSAISPQLMVRVVPDQFNRALQNLIGNAVKYTPAGGQIDLSAEQHDHEVWIKIADTGLGIPASDLPFIFDKFYRVRRQEHLEHTGAGMGMAIVKAIIERHQGHIWIESELGKGSTFFVGLPLAREE